MLEPRGDHQRWRLLGHLLPREVRERIFEPAFSDVLYRWLVRRRRLTRLGRVSLWAAGVAGAILLVGVQVLRTHGY